MKVDVNFSMEGRPLASILDDVERARREFEKGFDLLHPAVQPLRQSIAVGVAVVAVLLFLLCTSATASVLLATRDGWKQRSLLPLYVLPLLATAAFLLLVRNRLPK